MKITRRTIIASTLALIPCLAFAKESASEPESSDLLWGTYGISGKEKLKIVRLGDCSDEHLQAILDAQYSHITCEYEKGIIEIQQYRRKNGISVDKTFVSEKVRNFNEK